MMETFRYLPTSPPPDHDNNLNFHIPGPQSMSNTCSSTSNSTLSYFPNISSVAEWSKLSTLPHQYPTYRAPHSALSTLMTTPPHSPCPGLSRCSSPIDPSYELEIEELPDSYTTTDGHELLHGEIEEPSPDPPSHSNYQSPHFIEYKSDDEYEDLDLDLDFDMTSDEPSQSYQYSQYDANPNPNFLKPYTPVLPLRTHWTTPTAAIPVKQQKKRSWAESVEPSDDDYNYASDYSASSGGTGRIRRRRIAKDGGLAGEAMLNSKNSQVFAMEMEF